MFVVEVLSAWCVGSVVAGATFAAVMIAHRRGTPDY